MMKKRSVRVLALLAVVFVIAGCSGAGNLSETAGNPAPAEGADDEELGAEDAEPGGDDEDLGAEDAELGGDDESPADEGGSGKAAVVYFSATGTTEETARMIAREAGADIFEIVPETAYTKEDLDYHNDGCRANKEMEDDFARPAISGNLSGVSEYDIIYLGHPIWWGTAPRIIQTFLESCDLSGKTVYTFCTSGGSGIEKSVEDLQEMYPDVRILSGMRFDGASEKDVKDWIDDLE